MTMQVKLFQKLYNYKKRTFIYLWVQPSCGRRRTYSFSSYPCWGPCHQGPCQRRPCWYHSCPRHPPPPISEIKITPCISKDLGKLHTQNASSMKPTEKPSNLMCDIPFLWVRPVSWINFYRPKLILIVILCKFMNYTIFYDRCKAVTNRTMSIHAVVQSRINTISRMCLIPFPRNHRN